MRAIGLGRQPDCGRTGRRRNRPDRHRRSWTAKIRVGDKVALHWDWICDVINGEQHAMLDRYTARHLALVNSVFADGQLNVAGYG